MHLGSGTNTHYDITDLVKHGMVYKSLNVSINGT